MRPDLKERFECPIEDCKKPDFRTHGGVVEHLLSDHTDVEVAEELTHAGEDLIRVSRFNEKEETEMRSLSELKDDQVSRAALYAVKDILQSTLKDTGFWFRIPPTTRAPIVDSPKVAKKWNGKGPMRLTTKQLAEIRHLRKTGALLKDIGKKFGIAPKTVSYWTNPALRKRVVNYQRHYMNTHKPGIPVLHNPLLGD